MRWYLVLWNSVRFGKGLPAVFKQKKISGCSIAEWSSSEDLNVRRQVMSANDQVYIRIWSTLRTANNIVELPWPKLGFPLGKPGRIPEAPDIHPRPAAVPTTTAELPGSFLALACVLRILGSHMVVKSVDFTTCTNCVFFDPPHCHQREVRLWWWAVMV